MDMRFTFVATGKKGAVHDTAVFKEAITKSEHFPHPPRGKYCLVDSGYPLREGYMPLYRKSRNHLKDFETKGPENLNEIFNFHHSSLRNVVERSFGVLKNRTGEGNVMASDWLMATANYEMGTVRDWIAAGLCMFEELVHFEEIGWEEAQTMQVLMEGLQFHVTF
ncbi:hypothetical protein U9M48_037750 [Paspalum notatum var. saurae]|uniref:DDE Tnp4 domain-containing protein n=1 Tax=Paspalum notatum var. saurae TaxID=547442 RepID=A0AAQ3XAD2_PASNO